MSETEISNKQETDILTKKLDFGSSGKNYIIT